MKQKFELKDKAKLALLGLLPVLVLMAGSNAIAADELPPEGALMRAFLGDDATKKLGGLEITGFINGGYVYNFDANKSDGGGNAPGVPNGDTGLQFNGLGIKVDMPIQANMIPRAFPVPGPVPQAYDFGFQGWLTYGRNSLPGISAGWDSNWGINQISPADGTRTRHNYLSNQELFFKAYMPWGNGVTAIFGKFLSPVSNDIGLPVRLAPLGNFFYSRPYTFYGQPVTHNGLLVSANLWRSPTYGNWMAEGGVVTGWNNYDENNSQKSYIAALHWRSPDMSYGVDYRTYRGADQNDPNRTAQFGNNRLLANSAQIKHIHSLGAYMPLAKNVQAYGELTYGKQAGDGAASTIDIITGSGFSGATWNGQTVGVIYQHNDKWSFGGRLEHMKDPKGFGLYPLTTSGSDYSAATLGTNYMFNKHVRVRAEIRHDKQSNNAGVNVFNGRDSNTAFSTDVIVYF